MHNKDSKTLFGRKDEIRLFVLDKQSLCPEYGVHDAASEDIRVKSFDLQTFCSKYRHETWLAPSELAPRLSGNLLIRRSTNDVRIYDFDIQLTVRKMGSKYEFLQLKNCGARYVINESWKLDSLHVMKFKYCNSKFFWSICYNKARNKS